VSCNQHDEHLEHNDSSLYTNIPNNDSRSKIVDNSISQYHVQSSQYQNSSRDNHRFDDIPLQPCHLPLSNIGQVNNKHLLLDQLVQRINQKGGVTFVIMACLGIFAFFIFMKELDWVVMILLKVFSIANLLLPWYWISGQSNIRTATNAMFAAGLKAVLGYQCWPTKLQSWADTFNV
jgi:hypothetical protein